LAEKDEKPSEGKISRLARQLDIKDPEKKINRNPKNHKSGGSLS
jgi:hypothetical protein